MKIKGFFLSIALVCFVLGLMITLQYRATRSIQNNLPVKRAQDLTVELSTVQSERDSLAGEVRDLKQKLNKARAGGPTAEEALKTEIKEARQVAGLIDVAGPGIEVLLENPSSGGSANEANIYQIHDEDLLRMVNELRAGGAEAISINGQRVIATTEIRLAGGYILVNVKRLIPPYKILAIGPANALESSLRIKGGILDTLSYWGIRASILSKAKISIPSYQGQLQFKYAKPLKEGE